MRARLEGGAERLETACRDASAASSLSAGACAGPRPGSEAAPPSATPAENIATESCDTQAYMAFTGIQTECRFVTRYRLTCMRIHTWGLLQARVRMWRVGTEDKLEARAQRMVLVLTSKVRQCSVHLTVCRVCAQLRCRSTRVLVVYLGVSTR